MVTIIDYDINYDKTLIVMVYPNYDLNCDSLLTMVKLWYKLWYNYGINDCRNNGINYGINYGLSMV